MLVSTVSSFAILAALASAGSHNPPGRGLAGRNNRHHQLLKRGLKVQNGTTCRIRPTAATGGAVTTPSAVTTDKNPGPSASTGPASAPSAGRSSDVPASQPTDGGVVAPPPSSTASVPTGGSDAPPASQTGGATEGGASSSSSQAPPATSSATPPPTTPPASTGGLTPNGKKAGLAAGNIFDSAKDYIGWWYDWTADTLYHEGTPVAVPMLWGNGKLGSVQDDKERYDKYVELFYGKWQQGPAPQYILGFNEPDLPTHESANMDPSSAAAEWNNLIGPMRSKHNSMLISPAMGMQEMDADKQWLKTFTEQITTPYDIVAVHIYKTDMDGVRKVLDYYATFGKPMWVTEIGCADYTHKDGAGDKYCNEGQSYQFMKEAIPLLQNDPRVYAYAPANVDRDGSGWTLTNGASNEPSGLGWEYINIIKNF